MLHRLVLSTFSFLTLATCQTTQNSTENEKVDHSTTVKTDTKSSTNASTSATGTTTPKTEEPKMSVGLPPDADAVKEAEKINATKTGIVYLKEGENKFVKEYQMNVTFKQMSEDSRCPKDVNCIWAGVATADVEFMGLATRPMTLQISTINDANKGYTKTQSFNGYNITLVSVTPETTSAKGFKALKGTYQIGLKFEQGDPVNTTVQRGGTTTK